MALAALLVAVGSKTTHAQSVPEGALEAERDHRWGDAVALYQSALEDEPERADLWKRLAQVYAMDGRTAEAADAFERAAHLEGNDPELFGEAAAAQAMLNRPAKALSLVASGLELDPGDTALLRRRADLLTWLGDSGAAAETVRKLLDARPSDPALLLEYSRLRSWEGEFGEAARFANEAIEVDPDNLDAWLQLAIVESWKGHYSHALEQLEEYGQRGGDPLILQARKALVLAWADRPDQALSLIEGTRDGHPERPELLYAEAVALGRARRYDEVLDCLERLDRTSEDEVAAKELRRFLTAKLHSSLDGDAVASRDADGIERISGGLAVNYQLGEGDLVKVGMDYLYSTALDGSGLDPVEGGEEARRSSAWGGVGLSLSPAWTLDARGGRAWTSFDSAAWVYGASVGARLSDTTRFGFGHQRELFSISPRTLSLGLMRSTTTANVALAPSLEWWVDVGGEYARLSDGNESTRAFFSLRRAISRGETLNFDLGFTGQFLSFREDLDNGYYDPSFHRRFLVPMHLYWKLSGDDGISVVVAPGWQKDDKMELSKLAASLQVEATLGLYREWLFKIQVGATLGASDYSDEYWIASTRFMLVKRF